MKLVVVRHGIAVARDDEGTKNFPDAERALTQKGRRRFKRGARGLARLVPKVDVIASSPLVRARQTAQIVARHFSQHEPLIVPELSPSAPLARLLDWLTARRPDETVVIVGHEDNLSTFISWLTSGRPESHLALKKGGAALLSLDARVESGAARLEWLLTPRQLRQIAAR